MDDATSALELVQVTAAYAQTVVLRDVSLSLPPSSVGALVGANGAGKTTLLRIAAGLLKPKMGSVHIGPLDVTGFTPHRRAQAGICLIPEGRGVFRDLTVLENLELQIPPWCSDKSVDSAFQLFPELSSLVNRLAGTLSGGEQQMLALARTRLANPKTVLLDEVSMGLAPIVVDRIFEVLQELARTGVAILLVEQYVSRALAMADTAYVLNRGCITYSGSPNELSQEVLSANYLGGS